MSERPVQTFYLPRWGQGFLILLVSLWFAQFVLISVPLGVGLVIAAAFTVAVGLRRYTVQVRSDGVKLYSLWWLPWGDVRTATYRKVFGLPYFYVRRHHGWGWWIPLYFVGDGHLREAIVSATPEGHVLRTTCGDYFGAA